MSNRSGSASDDEPIIGIDPIESILRGPAEPEAVGDDEMVIGAPPRDTVAPASTPPASSEIEEESVEDDDYEDEEYFEHAAYYEGESPTRQPLFYLFLLIAVVVGALFVFLLIVLTRGDGDETDPVSVDQKPDIELKVDAPVQGDRVEIGSDVEVLVRGSATEDLVRFELYREVEGDPVLADTVSVSEPSPQGVYSSTLKIRFEDVGEYSFFVRVVTESGAFRDSASVGVVAYKRVMDVQEAVKGRAIALVTLRAGPGDQFAAAGRLQPGDEVDILGKTRDLEWLLLDRGTGVWVRQAAIEELDSLALVPVSEPTPTPLPATSTPEPSPTGSVTPTLTATPTLSPSAPDFIPANASLFDGGEVIQVTIANISPNAFAGALVVSVSGLSSGTIELVFSVDIPANGTEMVALPLSTAITEPTTVEVTVDPQNAIPEANEDNNRVQFQGLVPPEIVPELTITGVAVDSEFVRVTVINRGGPLPESTVSVRVTVGQQFAAEVRETSLGSGESQEFTITNPGPGTALIEILVDDLVATSVDDIELP